MRRKTRLLTQSLVVAIFSLIHVGAQAMTFAIPQHEFNDQFAWVNAHGGVVRIYASGPIQGNEATDLERFLKTNNITNAILLFDSPGGSLSDALALGQAIRKLGLSTGIATFSAGKMLQEGMCASACTYAFAGGVNRYYSAGRTRIGLHQFYSTANTISNKTSQEVSGILVAFLQSMGVDALAFSVSAQAGPDSIAWLSAEDALRLRFANNGTQDAIAELKLQDNITYLKIEQPRADISARFLFYCIKKQIVAFGGYVTTPEDSRNKWDWATRSFFMFDQDLIQEERKDANPKNLNAAGSVVWLNRTLSRGNVQRLLRADSISAVIGGDGFMTYSATAALGHVRPQLKNYVKNCYQ